MNQKKWADFSELRLRVRNNVIVRRFTGELNGEAC